MATRSERRDVDLLDAVDSLPRENFEGKVWRIVRNGKDPLQGYPAGARWDPGEFDVIYSACDFDGAHAEIHFHLNRAPVFPSRPYTVHTLQVVTKQTLKIADVSALAALGIDTATYEQLVYERTQSIGDAAYFLGFDGLLVPSARWQCLNLVIFVDRINVNEDIKIVKSAAVDWAAWRRRDRE